MNWGKAEGRRLKTAIREADDWTQEQLAEVMGMGLATLKRFLAGTGNPGEDRLAAMCAHLGVPISQLLGSEEESPFDEVDVYDVDVAAGAGRMPLGEEPVGSWPFPRDWLARHAGPGSRPAMVRVAGDSQEPELRDGDLVMIDLAETRLRDGLHVVRLDDRLMLKRVAIEGATVKLKSANPAYDDVIVDLSDQDQRLAVIGRAGIAVKVL